MCSWKHYGGGQVCAWKIYQASVRGNVGKQFLSFCGAVSGRNDKDFISNEINVKGIINHN